MVPGLVNTHITNSCGYQPSFPSQKLENVFVFLCMFGIFPNRVLPNLMQKIILFTIIQGPFEIDIPFPGRLKYHPADYNIYIYIYIYIHNIT